LYPLPQGERENAIARGTRSPPFEGEMPDRAEGGNLSPRASLTFTTSVGDADISPGRGENRGRTSLHRHPGLEPDKRSDGVGLRK